jgi:tetratricopeptide (TPR) repeat protein
MGFAMGAFVMVIIAALPAIVSARQLLSYSYQQLGARALASNDILAAAQYADRSQRVLPTGENLRLGISIDFAQMQKLANDFAELQKKNSGAAPSSATVDGMRNQFQAALAAAITQGKRATDIHPNDYQTYGLIGQVYEFLVPQKVEGAYESARNAYQAGMKINPTNPTLPLLLARLTATQDLKGKQKEIEALLQQSLTLKPNYTDALLFMEQVAVALNDLPTATQAAEAAVQSNPQNPALWFQVGLFYYTGQKWDDALKSFQNAVQLQNDYANAKYFLGLSLYKTGDKDGAIQQFRELAASHADNEEVKLILSNLETGKEPFAGQAPPQPAPEERPTAPVKESSPVSN